VDRRYGKALVIRINWLIRINDGCQVQRLRKAIQDYENDRWRIIASKVGHGFTPAACREKATEL
jgi:hypothetical protein